MGSGIHLLAIDVQNDFMDLPSDWLPEASPFGGIKTSPALPVPGAHQDALRLARLIQKRLDIDEITLTFDSHHSVGIERTSFWRDTTTGQAPAPFTVITELDGRFEPQDSARRPAVQRYLQALHERGAVLCVWPVHCVLGTWGHNLHLAVATEVAEWERRGQRQAHKVLKGMNPMTEHYSALRAEVPDPADPHTQVNGALIERLSGAEQLWVTGQASSHCVRSTVLDLIEHGPSGLAEHLVLVSDGMSPVAGFEALQEDLFDRVRAAGGRVKPMGAL